MVSRLKMAKFSFSFAVLAALLAAASPGSQYRKAFEPLQALQDGTLDVGFADIISAVHAIQNGVHAVMLAPAAMYDSAAPVTVMIAPKARPVHSGADMNGKKLAVPAPNDLGEIATTTSLRGS